MVHLKRSAAWTGKLRFPGDEVEQSVSRHESISKASIYLYISPSHLIGKGVKGFLVDVAARHDVGCGEEWTFKALGSLCHHAPHLLAEVVQITRVYATTQRPGETVHVLH